MLLEKSCGQLSFYYHSYYIPIMYFVTEYMWSVVFLLPELFITPLSCILSQKICGQLSFDYQSYYITMMYVGWEYMWSVVFL